MSKPRFGPSINRALPAILLWLVFGVVANITVAWTCVFLPRWHFRYAPEWARWPSTAPSDWPYPSTCHRADWWCGAETIASLDSLDFWRPDVLAGNGPRFSPRPFGPPPAADQRSMDLTRLGFPFHALEHLSLKLGSPPYQPDLRWGLELPWNRGAIGVGPILPLRPLWPGFALNTISYAALAWGVWQVPLAMRRRRRRARGQCVRCGYALAGLPTGSPCPECGPSAAK